MFRERRNRLDAPDEGHVGKLFRFYGGVVVLVLATAKVQAKPVTLQIRVVSAEDRTFQAPPLVPKDCTLWDFSGYCNHSSPVTYVEHMMVVRTGDGRSLDIGCTVYAKWSHCRDLPVDRSYQATVKKDVLEIRYVDEHHKWRTQGYEILPGNGDLTRRR